MAAISKRLRYEVLRRDGYTCRYCGAKAPDVEMTVDHVIPRALGGADEPGNLVAACRPCNDGKTSVGPDAPVVADVAEDALRWSQALAAAAEEMLADSAALTAAQEQFDAIWGGWTYGGEKELPIPKDPGWRKSVDALLAAGLPLKILGECVQIAMGRRNVAPENTFRYMCGIAWNKVTELQERAREIAGGDPARPAARPGARSYDQGRADAAREVLGELTETEREHYIEWADDGGYGEEHGEPQTEADLLIGAATAALNDIHCDLHVLGHDLAQTLAELHGGVGQRAMRTARQLLYAERGADFGKQIFLQDSLRHLGDELKLPDALMYLFSLPDAERLGWLDYAAVLYQEHRISDAGKAVRAARCARVVASNRYFVAMCWGRGEQIAACPAVATYHVKFAEMKCCTAGAEDHPGHGFCEKHLEQLMDGSFTPPTGRTYTVTDYAEIPEDAGAPF